jgi:hypothetical protein
MSGVKEVNGRLFVICKSLHMTEFTNVKASIKPKINTVNPITDAKLILTYDSTNMLVPIVLGSIVGAFILSAIIAFIFDMRLRSKFHAIREDSFLNIGVIGAPAILSKHQISDDNKLFFSERYIYFLKRDHIL